jgi:outer membrane receptor protein involved in Fe transport
MVRNGRSRTQLGRWLLLLMLILSVTAWASAQSTTEGAIGGTVTDPSGALVPGATVSALNVGTNSKSTITTDTSGGYRLSHLQPGTYTLEVSAQGFSIYKQENVIVEVGRTTTIDATLGLATSTTTIIATAEAPVITTDRPDISTNINLDSVLNLPINGRRWSNLVLSTPGAIPDGGFGLISFRGISGLLNNNTVDGGDNNQAFFAEEKGRTRISYSTSQASIQEYQVNSSNYSAEYGRSAGGVVNAVTKSGSNQLHGEAFWFYRSSDFGAFNPFQTVVVPVGGVFTSVPIKPVDKRHQFGGNIGGPIIKDKLFFFFNADQQLRNFPGVANASNASAFFAPLSASELSTLSIRGISAAQGNAGLAFLQTLTGVVPRTGDELLLFPKIDWKINPNHHFSAEYNRMRWSSPAGIQTAGVVFRGKESFGNDFVKDDTVIGRLSSTFSPTVINEFRFAYGRDFEFEDTQAPIPGEPVSQQGVSAQVTIQGNAGIVFGKPNFLNRRAFPDEKNYQFADTLSISRGKHFFKFGADINRVHDLNDSLFQESGAFTYGNRVDYISDYVAFSNHFAQPACTSVATHVPCYRSLEQGFGPPAFKFTTVDYGFFLQDDWRIAPRLTLNLGLRWDYEQTPDPQIPNPLLPATSQFPSDKKNFGPRVGAAWDITGRGKMVVRGGYGIFYGRIINSTISNAITNTGVTTGQLQFTFNSTTVGAPLYPNVAAVPPATKLAAPDVVVFASNTPNPKIHEFDASFEYQIATNTAISVIYMGSLGRHLPLFIDANLAPPTSTVTYTIVGGPDNAKQFTIPLFTARLNPNFGRITTVSDIVKSKYNALVVQFNRRMTKGLQVQAAYTYSQAFDNGQSSQTFTSSNNVLNPFDLSLEQGRSNFDVRHRFGASVVWQPAYFQDKGTLVRELLDGWTVAPIVTVASGATFTGTVPGGVPTALHPLFTSGINGSGGSSRPPWVPRNAFTQPRTASVDLRVAKKFKLYESFNFEVFGEAFNLFNHVNVTSVGPPFCNGSCLYSAGGTAANPTLTFQSSFGVPTASSNFFTAQRQIQIGARLRF